MQPKLRLNLVRKTWENITPIEKEEEEGEGRGGRQQHKKHFVFKKVNLCLDLIRDLQLQSWLKA